MKEAYFKVLGDDAATLGGFSSWLERLCWHKCAIIERMAAAEMSIKMAEDADFTTAEEAFENLSTELQTWLQSAVSASAQGQEIPALDVSYVPEMIQFLALIVTGNWGGVFILFVQVGIKFLINLIKEKLNPDNDVDEGSQVLREIFLDSDSAPGVTLNRLDSLSNIIILNPSEQEIDSTMWDSDYFQRY